MIESNPRLLLDQRLRLRSNKAEKKENNGIKNGNQEETNDEKTTNSVQINICETNPEQQESKYKTGVIEIVSNFKTLQIFHQAY